MKTNLISVFFCLMILLVGPLVSGAENADGIASDAWGSTTTVITPEEPSAEPEEPSVVELKKCTITLSTTAYTYNGAQRKPAITVQFGDTVFKKNTDYTVSYQNNINAGTAKAIVTAKTGSKMLTGSVTKYFRIDKKQLSSFKTKRLSSTSYVYTGKAFKPTFTFSTGDLKATLGTDFTVTYKNNKQVGLATVTAKGMGNYTGTYSKTFKICPAKVTGLKATNIKDTTFRLSWKAVSGKIDGYKIYRYNSKTKTYDYAVKTTNTYFDVSGRSPATVYYYKVKAYKKSEASGKESNAVKVIMKPKKTVVVPSGYKGKYFVFKWEKSKADGYQIKYSKNKSLTQKGAVLKTVKSGSKTSLKVKLSSKTKYYYRIRAYKKIGGKTYYGEWSDKKITSFSNVYSQYTTYFSSPEGRTTNIKVACEKIDGTILRPGETFSFNKIVGQRTPERGFKKATVYSGQETVEGYGGGVCQVSSTIFNAVLNANLKITERYQHSMTVHYVPYGRDAAISWGSADFKFVNSTDYDIKISAKVYDNSRVVIKLLTNASAKPKTVKLNVTKSYYSKTQSKYVLTRSVGGKVNYRTSSIY